MMQLDSELPVVVAFTDAATDLNEKRMSGISLFRTVESAKKFISVLIRINDTYISKSYPIIFIKFLKE